MICDNCIHNAVCERAHFENHCGYKHSEADVINPELEKIKDEIIQVVNEEKNYDEKWVLGLRYSVKIIDKYITELKGETNENNC